MTNKRKTYRCEECGLFYNNKSWAKKCWDWCKKHNSCNINITKHRIDMKGGKNEKA